MIIPKQFLQFIKIVHTCYNIRNKLIFYEIVLNYVFCILYFTKYFDIDKYNEEELTIQELYESQTMSSPSSKLVFGIGSMSMPKVCDGRCTHPIEIDPSKARNESHVN